MTNADAAAADPAIHAIVITYNTRDLAVPLLQDLVRELQPWPESDVVVFDNASTDDTAAVVSAAGLDVRIVLGEKNLGFGRAVNEAAAGATARWILLVNPDARIDEGAVQHLVDTATRLPGHGLYGGKFVDINRDTAEDSVAVVPTLANLLAFATGFAPVARRLGWRSGPRRAAGSASTCEVDALPGTFLLIETDVWREVGGFDPRYFMYSEDLDLSLRIGRTGRRPLYVPEASIRHEGGGSSSSGSKEVLKLTSLTTLLRSEWGPRQARTGVSLLFVGVGLRRLARLRAHTPSGRWETAWRERRRWSRGW
jgi:N-acetylglucosaminyl-diphospho-decaprenol L-rhamnosyltransferase